MNLTLTATRKLLNAGNYSDDTPASNVLDFDFTTILPLISAMIEDNNTPSQMAS